ncbi:hypothetical protein LSH36_342g04015 [Paralvinella palmiformis]|uniref:Uncharacterized protein n=1 Tax=Paralvinella palmiformis TaxID=53620 RepID=A0AAD9JG35_9ANNE|nr:hypothetical protein LSH36_342g04015 [Paralvinella palmiformis]
MVISAIDNKHFKLLYGFMRSCQCHRIVLLVVALLLMVVIINLLPVGSDRPLHMGKPERYDDEVDFRIIVLAYNRPKSLQKCLEHLAELDTLGDRVAVEIWIDRSRDGTFDTRTWDVAEDFRIGERSSGLAHVRVHVQRNHSYIIGQWVNTWRPHENRRELAVILEDDVDLSPCAYKWLKAVNGRFGSWPEVAGYTLQSENVNYVRENYYTPLTGPQTDPVFLYQLIGTWGFSPHPEHWRRFQDWFHLVWDDPNFRPYVPGTELNVWYRNYERRGLTYSMWEMFFVYYCHINDLYIVYSNLRAYTGRGDVFLDVHRQEPGLHATSRSRNEDTSSFLMKTWNPDYVKFPDTVTKYTLLDK